MRENDLPKMIWDMATAMNAAMAATVRRLPEEPAEEPIRARPNDLPKMIWDMATQMNVAMAATSRAAEKETK
jgi:hypothetical protein